MAKYELKTELKHIVSKKNGKTYHIIYVMLSNGNDDIVLCHYFLSDKDIALMGL